MALELNLTKNTNEQLEGTLGKYYARVEYKGTIGIKGAGRPHAPAQHRLLEGYRHGRAGRHGRLHQAPRAGRLHRED